MRVFFVTFAQGILRGLRSLALRIGQASVLVRLIIGVLFLTALGGGALALFSPSQNTPSVKGTSSPASQSQQEATTQQDAQPKKPASPAAPSTTPPKSTTTPSKPSTTTPPHTTTTTPSSTTPPVTTPPSPPSGGGSGGTTLQTNNCAGTPHLCGFPDATNTGPVGCSSYTQMTGDIEITDDNTAINCVHMTGSFAVYANNVTIQNSIIVTTNWSAINLRTGYSGIKVLHNTITGDVGHGLDNGGEDYGFSNNGSNVEAGWNNISEFGAAISTGNGNIHDNYGHDNQPFIPLGCEDSHHQPIPCTEYVHSDPFISSGGDISGLTVRHNTFFDPETTEMGASASIGLFYDSGPVSNTTVDDNLIAGGAYCVYPGGGPTSSNIVITNNHFSTIYWPNCGVYGPDATTFWHTGGGNVWNGNIWDSGPNIGQTVDP